MSILITGLLSFLKAEYGINPDYYPGMEWSDLSSDWEFPNGVEFPKIYDTDSILGCVEALVCVISGNIPLSYWDVNCQTRRISETNTSLQIRKYENLLMVYKINS